MREDFSNEMVLDTKHRYDPILFKNAPNNNIDIPLDQESNESIELDNSDALCKNCKIAACPNDYCGLQNKLFM